MPFFGNTYTLRRYGEDQIIDGYPTAGYEDIQVVLDVQTMPQSCRLATICCPRLLMMEFILQSVV